MWEALDIMKTRLDEKYWNTEKVFNLSQIVDTANTIRNMFSFTPEQLDKCVEILKDKLQELLDHHNKYWWNRYLGTIEMYPQDNRRTKTTTFMIDEHRKSIKTLFGEFLDSSEDYTRQEEMNIELEDFRRQNTIRQHQSSEEAKRIFIS